MRRFNPSALPCIAALVCLAGGPAAAGPCDGLISALQDDRVGDAKAAIRAGCHPDTQLDASGATPLMWARSRAMGEALLAAGATADKRDESGNNALLGAAARGDLAYMRLLISAGARADTAGRQTCGALCEAVFKGAAAPDLIRELINAGASVETADCWGRTVLFRAAGAGAADAARTALSFKASPNLYETYGGNTLLMQATMNGSVTTVDILLRNGADPNWPNVRSCQLPLHLAATKGDVALVRRLVEGGSGLSESDSKGKTALDLARASSRQEVAAYLERAGASSSGSSRTDCVNEIDTPKAWQAWQYARRLTRAQSCRAVVEPTLNAPSVGRSR